MYLIMTLLVRDEEDVIRENIEYHLSQGVDYFIVIDNASKDATTEILRKYEAAGVLRYIRKEGLFQQSKWVTDMARMAYDQFGADWVINNDADEFWWPTTDANLKQTLGKIPSTFSLVRVKRHNMLMSNQRPEVPFYQRNTHRRVVSLNFLNRPLPPKICHRGMATVHVTAGSHQIFGGHPLETVDGNIEIFHYPVRTFGQFKNKTSNIGTAYENNPQIDPFTGNRPGIVMRTVYDEYKRNPNSLERRYAQFTLGRKELLLRRMVGGIVKDERLSAYLKTLGNLQAA